MKTKQRKRLTTPTDTAIIKNSQSSYIHKNPTKNLLPPATPTKNTRGATKSTCLRRSTKKGENLRENV